MFISPIVKLLCRVLWFVLNKLLSQKSKSSPHRRRGRAVGSLRVRVRGNYAFISRMKFVTVGIAVTAEIVKRATRNHGYCGNRRTCNQKRKQTSLATGVCNRRGTQAGQITSGKKRDMGGGCSTKKRYIWSTKAALLLLLSSSYLRTSADVSVPSAAHRRAESRFWGVFIIAVHRAFVLGLGARHRGIVELSEDSCV